MNLKNITILFMLLLSTPVHAGITFGPSSDQAMTSEEYAYLRGEGFYGTNGMMNDQLIDLIRKMDQQNHIIKLIEFIDDHQRRLYLQFAALKEKDYQLYKKVVFDYKKRLNGSSVYAGSRVVRQKDEEVKDEM